MPARLHSGDSVTVSIITGDSRSALRDIQPGSVQCCVTSPPYFGLRDYGMEAQIGLEPSPEAFVEQLVAVFREVWRVLRDDGTLWVNIGDSYARTGGTDRNITSTGKVGNTLKTLEMLPSRKQQAPAGLKPKDLVGIPWRLAFALQADGWYLRQDIIWHKPNPMPESVTDRCTKAHEYLFLLSKSARYFWDAEAMQEASTGQAPGNHSHKYTSEYENSTDESMRTKAGLLAYAQRQRSKRDSFRRDESKRAAAIHGQSAGTHRADRDESEYPIETRNRRSVWTVATEPFKDAHFATFPPALIEPCIRAGSRVGDTVLDPFGGAGTTGLVADRLQRNAVLVELKPAYSDMARKRIHGDAPLFANVEVS